MKKLVSIFLTLSLTAMAFAQPTTEDTSVPSDQHLSIVQATQAYQDGEWETAITHYLSALQEPQSDMNKAYIYYNLGNAYFRQNELGKSIVNYERSLRLRPQDKDAQYNLKFAQSRITDNIESKGSFFLSQWVVSLRNMLNYTTWMYMSIVLFVLALASVLLFLFSKTIVLRKVGFHISWIALLLSISSLALAQGAYQHLNDTTEAIVMQGIVNVKSSPDRSGTDLFVIHEGTKVNISDTVGEWIEIHVGDNIGWIKEDNVERIVQKGQTL